MKVFLIGSCRIHRPFDCSKVYPGGKHELYNTLNTNWAQSNFVGSLYDTRYTLDVLHAIDTRRHSTHIRGNEPEFVSTCDAAEECDVFIIEIASMKYFTLDGVYVAKTNLSKDVLEGGDVEHHCLSVPELVADIRKIEALVQKMGKQVLFVSHFNTYNVPARGTIIAALTKHATHWFDPTPVVASDIAACIFDWDHYKPAADVLVMNALHEKLQSMA